MKYEYQNGKKFNSIEVTLAMGCKLDCRFCPQQVLLHNYFEKDKHRSHMMTFENFKKILSGVKQGGTICFSGMCEAFLNPQCDDMILYAYNQGYRITLLTTLVGFQKHSIQKLKHIDFDSITLHIPDKEGNSKFHITEEYLEVLRLFHNHFQITSYSCHGTVHPLVAPYLDQKILCSNEMMNRAGNLDLNMKFEPKGEIVCMVGTIGSYGNWTPEVLPDGTLVLCCMDYAMKHVLGNMLTMTPEEIFASLEYKKIQKGMKDDTIDILCRQCSGAKEISDTPAYHFLNKKQEFQNGNKSNLTQQQQKIIEAFDCADTVCVFGLGKLFWDNFFHQKWNEVIGQECYCDNDTTLWGQEINGIPCISPMKLQELSNPLIITHVNNDTMIREQLNKVGIKNIISIKDLYTSF